MTPTRTITTPTSRIEYYTEPIPSISITHAGLYLSVDLGRCLGIDAIESKLDMFKAAKDAAFLAEDQFSELGKILMHHIATHNPKDAT